MSLEISPRKYRLIIALQRLERISQGAGRKITISARRLRMKIQSVGMSAVDHTCHCNTRSRDAYATAYYVIIHRDPFVRGSHYFALLILLVHHISVGNRGVIRTLVYLKLCSFEYSWFSYFNDVFLLMAQTGSKFWSSMITSKFSVIYDPNGFSIIYYQKLFWIIYGQDLFWILYNQNLFWIIYDQNLFRIVYDQKWVKIIYD